MSREGFPCGRGQECLERAVEGHEEVVRSKAKHFPLQSELRWLHLGVRSLEPAAWLLFSLFQPSSLLNPCHGRVLLRFPGRFLVPVPAGVRKLISSKEIRARQGLHCR